MSEINNLAEIKPYSLYRRDDINVRKMFEITSNLNYNEDRVTLENIPSYMDFDGNQVSSGNFEPVLVYMNMLSPFYSFTSMFQGMCQLTVDPPVDSDFYDLSYDVAVIGSGKLQLMIDGEIINELYGNSQFRNSIPHKILRDSGITFKYKADDFEDDPAPFASIDNVCIYSYTKIDGDIGTYGGYSPAKTSNTVKDFQIIRGLKTYQSLQKLTAEVEFEIVFYSWEEYNQFQINAGRIHVLVDDAGMMYRGAIDLGEPQRIGEGVYYQKVKLKSSNELGVGWK